MGPATITITLEEGEKPKTELVVTLKEAKTWYSGDRIVNYSHPLSNGLVELNLFDEVVGQYSRNTVGIPPCNFFVGEDKKYYNDKVRLVYDRYLEVKEIQQLVYDPICITQKAFFLKATRYCCCCRTNFSCPVCGWST